MQTASMDCEKAFLSQPLQFASGADAGGISGIPVWQVNQAGQSKIACQGQDDSVMNNGNVFVHMKPQAGQAQQAQMVPLVLNQSQLAGLQGKQVVVQMPMNNNSMPMNNNSMPMNNNGWDRQESNSSTCSVSTEGMSYVWVPVPMQQVDFQQQMMPQAYQPQDQMNQHQDATMQQPQQQRQQMPFKPSANPWQGQCKNTEESGSQQKLMQDDLKTAWGKAQTLEKLQMQLQMAERISNLLALQQLRKRHKAERGQDGWQKNGQMVEGCSGAIDAGSWLPKPSEGKRHEEKKTQQMLQQVGCNMWQPNSEAWEQGQMQGAPMMMADPWGQGDGMYGVAAQTNSDMNFQQPARQQQTQCRGSQEQMQINQMSDQAVKNGFRRNQGPQMAGNCDSKQSSVSEKCENYQMQISQLQNQLQHLQDLQRRAAEGEFGQHMPDSDSQLDGRSRQGNGQYRNLNERPIRSRDAKTAQVPRRGQQGKGNSNSSRPAASFHSMPSGSGALAAAETMKSQLQALQRENPEAVFIARRINKLGHNSAEILQAHFQRFGPVKGVYVSHSRVKSLRSRGDGKPPEFQWRLRAAALGFVVMQDAEATAQILAEGPEHLVNGFLVRVNNFYHRGNGGDEEDDLLPECMQDGPEDEEWVPMARQLSQYSAQELMTAMPEQYED